MEGQLLGNRYLLLEKIGGGGMAVVYKAKCTLLNRFVAIKILRSEFTNDEEFVKRFKIEAQAVASLSHPNVVSVYDVGYQDDVHYIVMEYVDGMTLKDYINKNGALNWKDAVNITIQICSAIEHAHKNNIVHRDIKPHNILLTKEGIAKVTDFGIARAVTSSTITMVGSTIGSVHYFSPEQARGGFIDEKSDLYSLGIALYEMVTGRVPFDGDSPVSVALKHIQEMPIEPIKIVSSIPKGINEIIMKAIEKEQNLRYQSATEMLADLNRVLVLPQGGFITHNSLDGERTVRMSAINVGPVPSRRDNSAHPVRGENNEMAKQKKKNTATYWLAGITCVLLIGIAIFITWSLLFKPSTDPVYQVGSYIGANYDSIKDELKQKGFNISEIWKESDTLPKGQIIDQSIPPGTNYKNGNFTSLELTISSGPNMSTVPDVREREYRDAQNEIETQGLKWKIERVYDKEIPENIVIKTVPEGGEKVDAGSEVVIYVSKGKELKTIRVPNLVGKNEIEAQKKLSDSKLILGNVMPVGVTKGIVNKQLPLANEEVVEGDSVTIWLTPQEQAAPSSGSTDGSTGTDGSTNGNNGTGTTPTQDKQTSTQPQKDNNGTTDQKTNDSKSN